MTRYNNDLAKIERHTTTSDRHGGNVGIVPTDDVGEQGGRAFSLTVDPPKDEPPFQNIFGVGTAETKHHELASLQASQQKTPEGVLPRVHNDSQSRLGARAASDEGPQFSGGSVLPSSPALSAHSEDGQWDSIFPESIDFKLNLLLRDKRVSDMAPDRKLLATEGPKGLRWFDKTIYEGKDGDEGPVSASRRGLHLNQKSQPDATEESYIRYGLCRVIGTKHEAFEELEDPDQLEEKAISLICGFIHDHKYEHFRLEITWEYATLRIQKVPDEKYTDTIHSEIISKMVQNYAGKTYIPRKDLVRIMVPEVIRQIIHEDESLRGKGWTNGLRETFAKEVQRHSSRLQAVCIYQGLPMKFLKHLMDHEFRDLDPPGRDFARDHQCSERNCAGHLFKFFQMYYGFFAHKFDPDGIMQMFTEDDVLPLYFESNKNDSQLGYGSASIVYEVKIDPVHHSLSHDRNCSFALKEFHSRKNADVAFRREKDMIEKLANHPHEHITPYLATWIRGGVPCILFPRAKYNLRTFMSTTEEPKLTQSFVLWFLEQLKGLAGAVDHFHWIGEEERSAPGTSRGADRNQNRLGHDLKTKQKMMGLAGLHHDLKAENILIFEKQATDSRTAGVFKITDFGAGRFANLALGDISAPVKAARGTLTYKAPDEKPSRPFDLWALGCVFLELLIWAVTPEQDGGKGFSHRRGWMSDHKPGPAEQTHPDDAFWLLDPVTHKPKLRWSVSQQIEDLEKIHCEGKKAFTRVTQLTSKLFTIDPVRRPRAKEVLEEMERIYKEAAEDLEADPKCYTGHHARKISDSLSAADALHIHATPVTLKPEDSPARSLKRPLHEDNESESEQEPAPFRKLRRQSSETKQVPSVSESGLNIIGPSQSTAHDAHGVESEDDDLRHITPDDLIPRSHHANENTYPKPWQPR